MLLSMTGYGKATREYKGHKFIFEIKSLNSKQADITVKLPQNYRDCELELRAKIAKMAVRGKLEATLTVEEHTENTKTSINREAFSSYLNQIRSLSAEFGLAEPRSEDLFRIILSQADVHDVPHEDDDCNYQEQILSVAGEAICELQAFRKQEGEFLTSFLVERAKNIEKLIGETDKYEAERVPMIRERIEEAMSKVNLADMDKNRFEQEMIFYLEKLDVSEEKSRLQCHIDYFLQTIAEEENQGKKLGFILQEMGREINTLGSKSNHSEMQRIVVQMKDELEQMKEQSLNVL